MLPSWLFVIDTNFILSHLKFLDDLLKAHKKFGHVVLVPWAVVQELDGLKNGVQGRIDSGENLNPGVLARRANKWLFEKFAAVYPALWGQTKEECFDGQAVKGDDAILDCARFFQERKNQATCLLSNDRNLCVKALVHGKHSSYLNYLV